MRRNFIFRFSRKQFIRESDFDNGQLYVKIVTSEPVSAVFPSVDCIMSRNQVQLVPDPTATPTPMPQNQQISQTGEYFFPESNSRYLTDDEVSVYSSAQLELAKMRSMPATEGSL